MKYNIQILVKLKGTVAKRKGMMRARGKAGYGVKGIMGVSAVSLDPLAEKAVEGSRAQEKRSESHWEMVESSASRLSRQQEVTKAAVQHEQIVFAQFD